MADVMRNYTDGASNCNVTLATICAGGIEPSDVFSILSLDVESNTTSESHSLPPYTFLSLILSVISIVLNIFSMVAIVNVPGRLNTQLRLAASLTMADVLIPSSVLAHTALKHFYRPNELYSMKPEDRMLYSCSSAFNFALNASGHLVCLFNLVAMGVDHYVAILNPLRYGSIITKRRTIYAIVFIWILSFLGGFSMFLSAVESYGDVASFMNYCDAVMHNDYHSEYLVFAVAIVSFFIMFFTYLSVFCEVQTIKRRSVACGRDRKNRKAMWTTLLILGTFILFWIPSCIFQISLVITVIRDAQSVRNNFPSLMRASQYLYCLMLCNSVADPIIYAIRVTDVKVGYRKMVWKLLLITGCKSQIQFVDDESSFRSTIRSRCSEQSFFAPLKLSSGSVENHELQHMTDTTGLSD